MDRPRAEVACSRRHLVLLRSPQQEVWVLQLQLLVQPGEADAGGTAGQRPALQDAGLQLGAIKEKNSQQPAGYVLAQSPEEGTQLDAGSPVDITVSSGLVKVPEVTGLSEAQAKQLAVGTMAGAAELARTSTESPAVLRQRVTSKGGTTYAAITAMQSARIDALFQDAIKAAQARAQVLGDEFGKSD